MNLQCQEERLLIPLFSILNNLLVFLLIIIYKNYSYFKVLIILDVINDVNNFEFQIFPVFESSFEIGIDDGILKANKHLIHSKYTTTGKFF